MLRRNMEGYVARSIDTVVFDIGNVLIAWDPRNLYRRIFPDTARMEWFLTHVCSSAWNRRQDEGRSWEEAEAELIARFPQLQTEIKAYRARWLEMIPGPVEGMPALFAAVGRAGLGRVAISNFAADTFELAAARFPFLTEFEVAAVSGRLGLLKPEPAIYRWLIETAGIDPVRALFLDDLEENVEAARAIGLQAELFVDADGAAEALARRGVRLATEAVPA